VRSWCAYSPGALDVIQYGSDAIESATMPLFFIELLPAIIEGSWSTFLERGLILQRILDFARIWQLRSFISKCENPEFRAINGSCTRLANRK
jgi:hypothetical protein